MDVALLITAFGMGFVARAVGLPPLVGYLVAGFVLHGFGLESTEAIETLSDLGVLLLLFGRKLLLRWRLGRVGILGLLRRLRPGRRSRVRGSGPDPYTGCVRAWPGRPSDPTPPPIPKHLRTFYAYAGN